MEEFEADDFILTYLKQRIEHDGKYEWYDAPRLPLVALGNTMPGKAEAVRQAALLFEEEKVEKLHQLLNPLIEEKKLNFQTFSYILSAYLDRVMDKSSEGAGDGREWLCYTLIAIISFSGFFSRRLAELDVEYEREWKRDFRKEINQVSIYASKTLQKRIAEIDGYSWEKFCDDTAEWVDEIEQRKQNKTVSTTQRLCVVAIMVGVVAAGIGTIAFFHRRFSSSHANS